MKNWFIGALIGALTLSLMGIVAAQDSTANVQVRVWQSTQDAESLYISARPEGGSWNTLGTIPLDMSGLNSRGTFRYGDITLGVPLEESERSRFAKACAAAQKIIEESDDDYEVDGCYSLAQPHWYYARGALFYTNEYGGREGAEWEICLTPEEWLDPEVYGTDEGRWLHDWDGPIHWWGLHVVSQYSPDGLQGNC